MAPKLDQLVTLVNPGPPAGTDPVTRQAIPSTPVPTAGVPARLSQKPVGDVGSGIEVHGRQDTTVSIWTILVRPDAPLTEATEVVDSRGQRFQIQGKVAHRPEHRPQFLAASARLISDMQT